MKIFWANELPERDEQNGFWFQKIGNKINFGEDQLMLNGRIEELTGKKITWDDEPVLYETET